MGILATFEKQPVDIQDFDVDFTTWLASFSPVDTAISQAVVLSPGVNTGDTSFVSPSNTLTSGVVKVWTSGGITGEKYKVTVTLTTYGGRVKQAEFYVRVKDY